MPTGTEHAFRIWRRAGYQTALIGKNHCFAQPDDLELFDVWCEIGHEGLPDERPTKGMEWVRPETAVEAAHSVRREMPRQTPALSYAVSDFPLGDYSSGLVAGQTVRYLEERGEEPFVLWASFPDPHSPYEAPRRYFEEMLQSGVELPPPEPFEMPLSPERTRVLRRILDVSSASREDLEGLVAAYHAMVRFVDEGIGLILDALERTGLNERTIVVFCSDHGDFAGEHGMTRKGGAFYDCLTRVPLIVSWPGTVAQGRVEDGMVNLVDVVPTLLELQGLERPREMQGSLLPTVTGAQPRTATFSEYGAGGPAFTLRDLDELPQSHGLEASKASLQWREAEGRRKMIRTGGWKYVTDPMGDLDELYDLEDDPWELFNLAAEPARAQLICTLRSQLLEWSVLTEDPFPVPLPSVGREKPEAGRSTGQGGTGPWARTSRAR